MPPPATAVLHDEYVAQLERDLHASRANEKTSKAALIQLRQDLNDAYLKIARQQQKIDNLTKKLKSSRVATQVAVPVEDEPVGSLSGLIDLADPDSLSRKLDPTATQAEVRPPARLDLFQEGEAAVRIDSLWDVLPTWTKGMISREDARFLDGVIQEVRPDQVYEVGVASGSSSAVILSSMAIFGDLSRVWLHSYDIAETCYFDPSHAVGDATRAMVPDLLKHWKLNVRTTALNVPLEKAPKTRSLYFIDANHSHPWPALDLIALLPRLQTGDHVVLHDINLPTKTSGRFPDYGAQWFFDDWMSDRLVPDVTLPNIGAIIIPEDKKIVLASLVKTLTRPWPLQFTAHDHLKACEARLAEFMRQHKLG